MKKQNFKRLILSWGLFISLMLPMSLNNLHYILFHHHLNDFSKQNLQYQNNEKTHSFCSYPFVTEELATDFVLLTPFERIIAYLSPGKIFFTELIARFSNHLRGPPSFL
ncbi:MAG: hypothetical protein DSY76_04430 [Bacteroidetes bacterium]|nr:MAG: hypothetical protein DSY76_04430 [Bacteroidota bacterium]